MLAKALTSNEKKKRKQLAADADPAFIAQINHELVSRNMSLKDAMHEAFTAWLQPTFYEKPTLPQQVKEIPSAYRHPEECGMLEDVMESGDDVAIDSVLSNLKGWRSRLRPQRAKSAGGQRRVSNAP